MRKILILLMLLPTLAFASAKTVVYNVTNNEILQGSLESEEVSIASISKLMTVYTVMTAGQDLDEKLVVTSKRTSNTHLSKGMVVTRRDLLNLALIASDNIAAITLGENYPGGNQYFVYTMNQHANELGLTHTRFVEPTGLSPMNYSTTGDIVKLSQAVSQFDIVKNAAQQHAVAAEIVKGKKHTKVKGNPTIKYFGHDGIVTIKTGFTHAAGFCVTMLVSAHDQLYSITMLGAKSKKERQQFVEKSLKIINA